jgi:hypothetical protein
MTEPSAKPKRSIVALIWLIVSQLVAVASLPVWAVVAGFSYLAAVQTGDAAVAILSLAVWAYPLFALVLAIGAWVAFALRRNRLAAILSGLACAPPVLFYLFMRFAPLIGL